jgi:hypothetical protein
MTVPSMVVLWLAVLPSKQFAAKTCLVCTVIARRVVVKLDCKGEVPPKQSVGERELC